MKHLFITIIALLALTLTIGCKLRKVHKEETTHQKQGDSTHVVKQSAQSIDTTKKVSESKSKSEETGTRETTVYPTKGKPFTVTNGETFTGEVDSTKTKTTYHKRKEKQKQKLEQKGLVNTTSKTDSTGNKTASTDHTTIKNIDSSIDVPGAAWLIVILGIIGFGVYRYFK